MKQIIVMAPAKLNLNLHVLPEINAGGYHLIESINCNIDLADRIVLENQQERITFRCSHKFLSNNPKNSCIKAARLMKELLRKKELGVNIGLTKNIPFKAGLGGGSADAAATILGLQELWQADLSQKQLDMLAANLGMDVYYCLKGGLARVWGTGERVEKLDYKMPGFSLAVVVPDKTKKSTAWAYKNLDANQIGENVNKQAKLLEAVRRQDFKNIIKNLHNDFEDMIIKHYPVIGGIKADLSAAGASRAMLAGSGLSVVGFFAQNSQAQTAVLKLRKKYQQVILSQILQG